MKFVYRLTNKVNKLYCVLLFPFALMGNHVVATEESESLENFLTALNPAHDLVEQQKGVTLVLRKFKANRQIPPEPHRIDYTDYYPLLKPVQVFGHDLVILEVETMGPYIGCCVDEGVGMLLRLRGSTDKLYSFAKAKGCGVDRLNNPVEYLRKAQINVSLPVGVYASVSCRERDTVLSR